MNNSKSKEDDSGEKGGTGGNFGNISTSNVAAEKEKRIALLKDEIALKSELLKQADEEEKARQQGMSEQKLALMQEEHENERELLEMKQELDNRPLCETNSIH